MDSQPASDPSVRETPPHARRHFFASFSHFACILLTLSGLFLTAPSIYAAATATITKGTVEMIAPNGQVVVLGPGDKVPLGAKIKGTAKDGVVLSPAPGVEVTLGENASVELNVAPSGELAVKVLSGSLGYKTSSDFKGTFEIQTSSGNVDVKSGAGNLVVSGNSLRVTSSSGSATFSGAGRTGVEVPLGNVLGVSGTNMTVTDVKNQTVSQIGMDKSVQSTRKATSADLQLAAAVQAGVPLAESPQASIPPAAKSDSPLINGSVNPTNISPNVNSPEQ